MRMDTSYDILHLLEQFGLTPKQAKVYLAALQLGTSSVQDIAREAETERTNAYGAIEALIARRLMSVTTSGKKQLYVAEPPERLESLLSEQRDSLSRLLPELRSLHNQGENKPRIRYYPGLEGYKAAYDETLDATSQEQLAVYSVKDILDVLGREYVDRVVTRRVKLGIHLRVVRSRETEIRGVYPTGADDKREVRLAPAGMVFPIATYVCGNKVIFLSSKRELFGLVMESADIAQAQRNYIEALWEISEVPR